MFVRMLVVLAALGAAGCSEAPWVQTASADAITLRWYPSSIGATQAEAQSKADAHCAATGKRASLGSTELNGSVQIATYYCQ